MEVRPIDPGLVDAMPCFAGTRVPIQNLFDDLQGGESLATFLDHFPTVLREQAARVIEIWSISKTYKACHWLYWSWMQVVPSWNI